MRLSVSWICKLVPVVVNVSSKVSAELGLNAILSLLAWTVCESEVHYGGL